MVLLMVAFVFLSSAAIAQEETAEIKFVNDCSFWIKVYVDDVPSGSIPPKDSQTTTATLGKHTLKAETVQTTPQTVKRVITLETKGFTWTLYEEEKKK